MDVIGGGVGYCLGFFSGNGWDGIEREVVCYVVSGIGI